jgi:hypothetical protein
MTRSMFPASHRRFQIVKLAIAGQSLMPQAPAPVSRGGCGNTQDTIVLGIVQKRQIYSHPPTPNPSISFQTTLETPPLRTPHKTIKAQKCTAPITFQQPANSPPSQKQSYTRTDMPPMPQAQLGRAPPTPRPTALTRNNRTLQLLFRRIAK